MTHQTATLDKADADVERGACYIPDPQTGEQKCHYITRTECDNRNGDWVGGLCDSADAVGNMKLKPNVVAVAKTRKIKGRGQAKKKKKRRH